MASQYFIQALFMVSGLLALGASVMDWDWFFLAQNTRWLVTKIGRNPARLVYGILGFALILMSVFFFRIR